MAKIHSVCVYCGSGPGNDPVYAATAEALGREIASHNIRLIYGGGSVGLMGTIARSVLDAGGNVTGIIPEFLEEREVMLRRVTDLIVTKDMHERKKLMFDKADAFVALPGGIGTLEEVVEMMTWAQLGQHKKPILLANIDRFWEPLQQLLNHMREEAFIREGMELSYLVENDVENIVPRLIASVADASQDALSVTGDSEPFRRF
ncbi:MAG: TIGR00730 family Rossman fold protein [Stappiaceae bacterium]